MGKALITSHWDDYLKCFPWDKKDIYFTEEYVKLGEDDRSRARCFVYQEDENFFLFPYLQRKIDLLDGDYYDFETAYGYGGPIANISDAGFFRRAFADFCSLTKRAGIIAGFMRFHSLLANHRLVDKPCDIFFNRKTVVMDLDAEEDNLWAEQIHPKHRSSIRLAEKRGLEYQVDTGLERLDTFKEIYRMTMGRVRAEEYYFFSDEYFNRIRDLGQNVFLGMVALKGKVIAAALFFRYGPFGHYHLSGSREEYRKDCPNNFLVYRTALYMKRMGLKQFHLGGGSDESSDNTLFKFKRRFSNHELDFYIGKLILDQNRYQNVCDIWETRNPSNSHFRNLFLKYRYGKIK